MGPKEHFYSLLEHYMVTKLQEVNRSKFVISAACYQEIYDALKLKKGDAGACGKDFKRWATDLFQIIKIGAVEYVYTLKSPLPVAKKEDLYAILKK